MFDQNSSLFQHPRSGRKYDSVPVSRLAVFYTGVVFVTSDSNMFGLFRNFYYKNLQATGSLWCMTLSGASALAFLVLHKKILSLI